MCSVLGDDGSSVADELCEVGLDAQTILEVSELAFVEILKETGLSAATRTRLIVKKNTIVNHLPHASALLKDQGKYPAKPTLGVPPKDVVHMRWYLLFFDAWTLNWAKPYNDPLRDEVPGVECMNKTKSMVEGQNSRIAVVGILFFQQMMSNLNQLHPQVYCPDNPDESCTLLEVQQLVLSTGAVSQLLCALTSVVNSIVLGLVQGAEIKPFLRRASDSMALPIFLSSTGWVMFLIGVLISNSANHNALPNHSAWAMAAMNLMVFVAFATQQFHMMHVLRIMHDVRAQTFKDVGWEVS